MNRSEMREQAFYLLYEKEFFEEKSCAEIEEVFIENFAELSDYGRLCFETAFDNRDKLDEIISKYLKGWRINRIPKVNLAILRLALCEMLYFDEVPESVAINEAVELAKKFSGDGDYSFINGILGSYSRDKE